MYFPASEAAHAIYEQGTAWKCKQGAPYELLFVFLVPAKQL